MLATIQFTSDFMPRLHLTIHGRVHGVFFRHGARQVAERLGLVGFVKNCPNGCVEVLAKGEGRLEALNPKSRRPAMVRTRSWPSVVIKEIRRLRDEHPNLGKDKIFLSLGLS